MLKKLNFWFIVFACISLSLPVWANGPESEFDALISEGRPLFLHYCAHCHGIQGHGDGYNAEQLDKEPAELSDTEFIAKKTNDQIFRVISQGGVGVRKSHLMPVFGHTLSEVEIWSLVPLDSPCSDTETVRLLPDIRIAALGQTRKSVTATRMSAFGCRLNRSMQHKR